MKDTGVNTTTIAEVVAMTATSRPIWVGAFQVEAQ